MPGHHCDSPESSAPQQNRYTRRVPMYSGSRQVGIITPGGWINNENGNSGGDRACSYSKYARTNGSNDTNHKDHGSNGSRQQREQKAFQQTYDETLAINYIRGLRFTGTPEEEEYLQKQLDAVPFGNPRTEGFFDRVALHLDGMYSEYKRNGYTHPDFPCLIAQRLEKLCERPERRHPDHRQLRPHTNPITPESATKLLVQAGNIYYEIGRPDMSVSVMRKVLGIGTFAQENAYLQTLGTVLYNGTRPSKGLTNHLVQLGYEEIAVLQSNGNGHSTAERQYSEDGHADPEFNSIFHERRKNGHRHIRKIEPLSPQIDTEVTRYSYLEAKRHKVGGRTEEALNTYEENLRILVGLYDPDKRMNDVVNTVFSESSMVENLPPELADDIFDWTVELVHQIYESRNSTSEEQRHRHIRKAILSYIVGKAKCCDYRAQLYPDSQEILNVKLAVLKQAADIAALFNPNYGKSAEIVSDSLSFPDGYWEVEGFAGLISDYYEDALEIIAGDDERFRYTRRTTREVKKITVEHYEGRGDLMWSSGDELSAMQEYANREMLKGDSDRSLLDKLVDSISVLRDKTIPKEPKDVIEFCNSVLERAQAVYTPESIEFIQVQTIVINNLMEWIGQIEEAPVPAVTGSEKKAVGGEWYKALKGLFLRLVGYSINNFEYWVNKIGRALVLDSERLKAEETNEPEILDQKKTPPITLDTLYEELDILGKSLSMNIETYLNGGKIKGKGATARSERLITDSKKVLILAAEEFRKHEIYRGNNEKVKKVLLSIAESDIDLFEEIVGRQENPRAILDGFNGQEQRLYRLFIQLTRLVENNEWNFQSHKRFNIEFSLLAQEMGTILSDPDSTSSLNSEILLKCQEMLHRIAYQLPTTMSIGDMPSESVLSRPLSVGFAPSH